MSIYNYLSINSKTKTSNDRITDIAFLASQMKQKGKKVINGTLGVFLDENFNPMIPEKIKNIFNNLSIENLCLYSPMAATENFKRGILNILEIESLSNYSFVYPTSGGLSALHHFFMNFADSNTLIISFYPYWSPYNSLASEIGLKIVGINIFNENFKDISFENLKNFLQGINNNKIIFILNTPAQNPTGLTLSENELNELAQLMEIYKKRNNLDFILFLDLSYIHMSKMNTLQIISPFIFKFPVFIGFSISKSLSLYGFRTGAIIYLSKSKEDFEILLKKFKHSSRADAGSINSSGYKIIEILKDTEFKDDIKKTCEKIKSILKIRSKNLIQLLNKYNIPFYRYDEGFFISIFPGMDNNEIEKKFKFLVDNGVFFVPSESGLRIAISSINKEQINDLENIFSLL